MLDKALPDARVDSVHMGYNLPQPFTGKDVLIGITDWGFDYTNPNFYDTTLQHTRIAAAWDQWKTSGPAPSGFLYGTEFNGESELLAAQCDTSNVYGYAYHGSHVAGIAGGSGAGTVYRGVAFEANYLFTTFLVDAAAVLDAYNWMYQYSLTAGKRLVINQSWGLYYMGNLDGTSLISQAIDSLSALGVVFVSSAGNNGDADFHLMYDAATTDTLKTQVQFDSYSYYPQMFGQCLTLWGTPGNSFEARLQVLNSSGSLLAETPFYLTDTLSAYVDDTLFAGADTVLFNVLADSANLQNQRPFMQIRVASRNTTNKVILQIHADTGIVHAWNLIELNNGVGNWGSDFLAPYAGYTAGDPYYGVGEPACAHSSIAVAAHVSEYKHPTTGQILGGNIAYFSSYGPIMDGTIKPEISAPGSGVCSSVSSFTTTSFSSVVTSVAFGGRTYKFVRLSGTSMSSPLVTGVVALMLEADPTLTAAEIKTILEETAREDSITGDLSETGDTHWGWGKVNALHAIYKVLGVEGLNEINEEEKVLIYPNPASDQVCIFAADGIVQREISLHNVDGRLIKSAKLTENNMFSVAGLPAGLYFVRFVKDGRPLMMQVVVSR
jgi:subtilisin family serine protease